jgi:hypothetical protein
MELCLVFTARDEIIPNFTDDNLFDFYKSTLINEYLINPEIPFFGYAPDNTADGNDNLLIDGTLFRIIAPQSFLTVTIDSPINEVISDFRNLIINKRPFWSSVIVERGFIKKETTIEFLFKD